MPTYAIGDIHGQYDMLRRAHDLIEADRAANADPDSLVVHLGDLTDRGPRSKDVIDFLLAGASENRPWTTILGNHDRMFRMFIADPEVGDPKLRVGLDWLDHRLGGTATLASYGLKRGVLQSQRSFHREPLKTVPQAHVDFLNNLPLFHQTKDVFFVHAGIRPGVPLDEQTEDDMVWIREPFLTDTTDHGPLIVHGHTVVEEPTHYGNRIALDTGAGYGKPLTAAVFEGRKAWVLTDEGRVPLISV